MTNRFLLHAAFLISVSLSSSYAVTNQFTSTGSGSVTSQTLNSYSITAGNTAVCWTGPMGGGRTVTGISNTVGDTFVPFSGTGFISPVSGMYVWYIQSAVGGSANWTVNYSGPQDYVGLECIDTGKSGLYSSGSGNHTTYGSMTPPITVSSGNYTTGTVNELMIGISNIYQVGGMNNTSPAISLTIDTITGLSSEYLFTNSIGTNSMSFTYSSVGVATGSDVWAIALTLPGGGSNGTVVLGGKFSQGGKILEQ